jgi:TldD protein
VFEVLVAEFLIAAVRALEKAGARFGDVRMEDRSSFVVRVANEQIQTVNRVRRNGWGVRAFVDGAWGYSSGTTMDTRAVVEAVRKATAIARANAAAGVPPSKLRKPSSSRKTVAPKLKIDPKDVSGEEKVAAAMEVCRAQKRDGVSNTNASYNDSDFTFDLANTAGARLKWREVRVRIAGQAVAGEGDRREAAYEFQDGTAGWELVKAIDLGAFGRRVATEAVEMLAAGKPPAGLMTVVSDPGVSGLLAHEVIGHASEGDEIVKKRSFLTDKVGKRVGSDLITMLDDGTFPAAHGSIPFDAEGTPSHKTKVIERGIYRGFLHSLETSGTLGASPTGNGRAQDFGRRVWVRMTNTYFAAGKDRTEELIEETKSGVLTKSWISGMEDPVGGSFQAVTQSGFVIRKGEVGERVRGMTLTGDALSILKSVDMVSRDLKLDGGSCGKGEEDYVPVAAGGPHIRCKIVVGGG